MLYITLGLKLCFVIIIIIIIVIIMSEYFYRIKVSVLYKYVQLKKTAINTFPV